jgi:type I restriction enzyme S subunit
MDVPEGWELMTLGEMADVITKGTTPKTYGMEYTVSGIPFLRVENITRAGTISLDGVKYVSTTTHDALKRSQARPGDMLFSIAGALGRVALVPEEIPEANMNQAVALVRLRDAACHRDYLRHALLGAQTAAQVELSKAALAQANLNLKQVAALVVAVPPLGEQRKIAAILSSVDEAIEKTQAVIDQVQVVKKGLMQELLTRGLPGRHKKFKQTEIGEFPASWELVMLEHLLSEPIRNGYSPVCPANPTGLWVLHLGAVGFDGYNAKAVKPAPMDDLRVGATILTPGDLLVSRSNTRERVGLAGIYTGVPETCAYPDLLMRVRPDNRRALTRWLELWILSPYGRKYMEGEARGTSGSMVKVNREILARLPVPIPPLDEQTEISELFLALDHQRAANVDCTQALTTIKQALMSVLLTGEIRVTP